MPECYIVLLKHYKIHHGNNLMKNKHRKLFVIRQSEWCKFMPTMHQNTFGGRVPLGPDGELTALPQAS